MGRKNKNHDQSTPDLPEVRDDLQSLASDASPRQETPPAVVVQRIPTEPVEDVAPQTRDAFGIVEEDMQDVDLHAAQDQTDDAEYSTVQQSSVADPASGNAKIAEDAVSNSSEETITSTEQDRKRTRALKQLVPKWTWSLFFTSIIAVILFAFSQFSLGISKGRTSPLEALIWKDTFVLCQLLFWGMLFYILSTLVIMSLGQILNLIEALVCRELFTPTLRSSIRYFQMLRTNWSSIMACLMMDIMVASILKQAEHGKDDLILHLAEADEFRIGIHYLFLISMGLAAAAKVSQLIAIHTHEEYFESRLEVNAFCIESLLRIIHRIAAHSEEQARTSTSTTSVPSSNPIVLHRDAPLSVENNSTNASDESSATEIASYIFKGLSLSSKSLMTADAFFNILSPSDAQHFFAIIAAGSGPEGVSKTELGSVIKGIIYDRNFLAQSLDQQRGQLKKLDTLLYALTWVVLGMFGVALFDISMEHLTSMAMGFIVSTKFIFAHVLDDMYQSIVFLFINHPFDIGDKVVIPGHGTMFVKSMGWYHTRFQGGSREIKYLCNKELMRKAIGNIRRSGPQYDYLNFTVSLNTTAEQLKKLGDALTAYCRKDIWNFDSGSNCTISVESLLNNQSMVIGLCTSFRDNFQISAKRDARRALVFAELRKQMAALNIKMVDGDCVVE